MAVCLDYGKSFRYDLYEAYKASRDKTGADEGPRPADHPYAYFDELVVTMEKLNIPVVYKKRMEADDLLATIGHHARKSVLVSKDKDQFQCLSATCEILQPGVQGQPDKLYTVESFTKEFRLTPKQYLDYQTLIGDKIDNIPALYTPAVARVLILGHGSLVNYLRKTKLTLKEVEAVNLNRKLVKMRTDCFEFDISMYRVPKAPKRATKNTKYMEMIGSVGKKSLFT